MSLFQSGAGNKLYCYVALLPLGSRTAPTDVTSITVSTGIPPAAPSPSPSPGPSPSPSPAPAGSTVTLTLSSALTGTIAGGTPLVFADSSGNPLYCYLTQDALEGASTIYIEAPNGTLSGTCTADYVAKQRLLGGTQADLNVTQDRAETLVFEDALGFTDGVITKRSWQIPWTANLLFEDQARLRILEAIAGNAVGREVYVWAQYESNDGSINGIQGAALITDHSESYPANNIITTKFTIMGQGSPTLIKP